MARDGTSAQLLGSFRDGAVVKRRSFDGQNLATARAGQLWFDRCSFVSADLRHATLDGCSFKMCDFRSADLRGASLRGASFGGCDLRDADLRDADLTGVRLDFVNTGAHPHGLTNVTGANFAGARLRDVQVDRVIGWPE
ncbi:pentapeptide repeat-containing protein [Frankia sp. AgB1.9]|nr:pentapeptide repeat-containing protein [Frankia sp. AgW1.1]MBL7547739.1 pentapeptide repeat-containing protein [Frankia sp. AgB1.9]